MKNKTKKKIVIIVVGILITLGIVVGISYAWWTARATQKGVNTIKSDCLRINLIDENPIGLEKAYPTTDKEAESLTPYTFTIENVCNTSIVYDVNLEVLETENRLKSEYIALEFNGGNKRILNAYPKVSTSLDSGVEAYGLASGSLKGKESVSYSLKLWMDEHVTINDDAMNKEFQSKVVVNASLNQVVDTYKEEILNGADPVLSENLIPVEIGNDGKVTKANTENEWYRYGEKRWANAVILEDESITYQDYEEIPESNIESYFVWIPKYSYQLWDLGEYNSLTTIDETKPHIIPIKFGLTNTNDSVEGECTTPMTSGASGNCQIGDYMTPPAFITMGTNGLWVGKFETGYKGATTTAEAQVNTSEPEKVEIKPNVYSWRNINVSNAFYSSYNYKRELDSHMMKNTEWGAVAYLQHSAYGSATNVRINNNNGRITGYAGVEEPTCGYTGDNRKCNRYESTSLGSDGSYTINYLNPNSQVASTTGNYSGIYDMSGGAREYVMGVREDITAGSSGFNISNTLETKYYDVYNNNSTRTNFQCRILGDATGEFGPFAHVTNPNSQTRPISSWYSDESWFVYSAIPWFIRGSHIVFGVGAGVFEFGMENGAENTSDTFRIVLAI